MKTILSGGKRWLALLLACMLLTALLPVPAAAEYDGEYDDRVQNGDTGYFDANGDPVAADSDEKAVTITKEIEATEEENVFRITLTVDAQDVIKEVTKVVGADVVLVFDLSGSMDSNYVDSERTTTRWAALKSSANTFIDNLLADSESSNRVAIVGYGSNSDAYATIQDWTDDASIAKGSYGSFNTAASLRQNKLITSGNTNCQAGFRAADEMLDTARGAALTYVVYMTDGEANSFYCANTDSSHSHTNSCSTYSLTGGSGTNGNSTASTVITATQEQAKLLLENHSGTKIYTIGFTTGTNTTAQRILMPLGSGEGQHSRGNPAVDTYYSASDGDQLTQVYNTIQEKIWLETHPWTVFDPMSQFVDWDTVTIESGAADDYVDYDPVTGQITWNIYEQAMKGDEKQSFTLSYTFRLDTEAGTPEELEKLNPTNRTTLLSYKIVEGEKVYDTVTVEFDVPQAKTKFYTVTIEHYIDGQYVDSSREVIYKAGGDDEIILDDYIKYTSQNDIQYLGRKDTLTQGETWDYSGIDYLDVKENDGLVLEYHYETGYKLTISYKVQGSGELITEDGIDNPYVKVLRDNTQYNVTHPDFAGYTLVDGQGTAIAGTINEADVTREVFYIRNTYKVTYAYEGTVPTGAPGVPTDTTTYTHGDPVTVKDVPSLTGYNFTGWSLDGQAVTSFIIKSNTTLYGTWTPIDYKLDAIVSFADNDDEEVFLAIYEGLDTAGKSALIAAIGIGDFYESYEAADGTTYENVFVLEEKRTAAYDSTYDFSSHNNRLVSIDGTSYKMQADGIVNGKIAGNTTAKFELTNNMFQIAIQHYKESKNGGYVVAETEYLSVAGNGTFEVTKKDYEGFEYNASKIDGGVLGTNSVGEVEHTVKLYYDALTYDVTYSFVGDIGHGVTKPSDETVWYGETVTRPSVAVPNGWRFDGWYTDEDCTVQYNFGDPITGDLDLYGKWTHLTYTVTFAFTPEGSIPETAVVPQAQPGIYYNGRATAPGAIIDSDFNTDDVAYTFSGWYTNSQGSGTPFDFDTEKITGSITLYGIWTKTSRTYSFTIEHYYEDETVPFTTTNGPVKMTYGHVISDTAAAEYALGNQALIAYKPYAVYNNAIGTTITATEANNIVKIYYVAREFTLNILYQYENGLSIGVTDYSELHKAGFAFSVDSPTVQHFHITKAESTDVAPVNGTTTVTGKMPGKNATVYVYYAEDPKYTVTVEYRELGSGGEIAASAEFYNYAGESLAISDSDWSDKEIDYYKFDSVKDKAAKPTAFPSTDVTYVIYFTRNQNTLKVNHVDASGTSDFSGYDRNETLPQGSSINVTPITPLPDGYKLISASAEGRVTKSGNDFTGTLVENVEITYIYTPLANCNVIINYLIEGTTNQVPGAAPYILGPVQENASYDVTNEYNREITGYTRVTDTATSVAGTMGISDVTLNVYYTVNSYPYEVVYINDYTGAEIARYDDFTADFGTTLNAGIVGAAMAERLEDGANWIYYHMPSGYSLNGVIYCTINEEENIVEVHYALTPIVTLNVTKNAAFADSETDPTVITGWSKSLSRTTSGTVDVWYRITVKKAGEYPVTVTLTDLLNGTGLGLENAILIIGSAEGELVEGAFTMSAEDAEAVIYVHVTLPSGAATHTNVVKATAEIVDEYDIEPEIKIDYDNEDGGSEATVSISRGGSDNNNNNNNNNNSGGTTNIAEEETPLGDLDMSNHFAYIVGYPDGTVRPEANITRGEVAAIFFRLLTQESRAALWSKSNGFSDVAPADWYNNAISTLSNGNILSGYPDGTFKPNGSITRAELATIAARFATKEDIANAAGTASFSDISGHWAKENIALAAALGYVSGYPDGTFRPDEPITRAEVATLLNNVLNRSVESNDDLLENMKTWPDNTSDAWYYCEMQEATNSHFYEWKTDGLNEIWTATRITPDWSALNRQDAKPEDVSW